MGQTWDRDDEAQDVDTAFADQAFADLKVRGAPFVILRPAAGEAVWANVAAGAFWGVDTAAGLAEVLLGPDGRSGWLEGLTRGLVPGRPPRLARAGLSRGFRMRARTALVRAWADRGGATLIGLAVPGTEAGAASDGGSDHDAWRRPAWTSVLPPTEQTPARPVGGAAPADGEGDGPALAQRGHLAVLRDRLSRALDGAATLRMLWRTDGFGAVTSIDAASLARLGSPLRFRDGPDGVTLPDAVAPFDPAGAERLRAALAGRATFAGIGFDLPVADGAAALPMAVSGSPVFGPDRAFAGFRGFGTVDLGHLALAGLRTPAAETTAETAAETAVEPSAEPARGAGAGGAGAEPEDPRDAAPDAREPAPEADEPPEAIPSADGSPRLEREPPANVVQLRAFQGSVSGRLGPAVPQGMGDGPAKGESPAAEESAVGDGAPGTTEDGPLSDQLAFLALGEALRARIGEAFTPAAPGLAASPPEASPPEASPPEASLPETPPSEAPPFEPSHPAALPSPEAADEAAIRAAGDSASALLERLPIPVLAAVDGRTVFANPAAAARLGYPDVDARIAGSAGAVAPGAEAGRIVLEDASGKPVSIAARRAEIPWEGRSATLWLLAEVDEPAPRSDGARGEIPIASPAPARSAAAGGEDDRSVELLDRVDDAVALLDAAGRLRRLNRRGEAWFGRRDPEAQPGQGLAELLVPESRPAALALLGEVRNQRDGLGAPPLRRDVVARTAEGAAVPMVLTVGRLGGSNGASGFYATLRDVSALQRAEFDRARTERDRARAAGRLPDLLAKVSHEIRAPLGAILGFAEVMMDERFGPLGNPRYKDYLKDIHASGSQVVALVEDLLDLSRIEAGQLDLEVAAVDLNRVVTEAVAQMQPEAHRERVIMRTSLAGRVPPVLADERSARQIVKSLLSNAVKFNEPGGQVIVSTALGEDGFVLLRVRDTGLGMSEEAIAAALEPFGGLPARASAQNGGSGGGGTGNGLGLPLTRALVGANGASMTIRSRPREGTLVEVSFAAAAEEAGARRPA